MQKPQPKHMRKKEQLPEKLNLASRRPSAHKWVAFFRRCVSENADKGGMHYGIHSFYR